MPGRLTLVGTPIGNLADITQRAVDALRTSTRVYAEDTRRTRALLTALGIEGKKLVALHAHSPDRAIETALVMLQSGEEVALVTDAGMPAVSDPGARLVAAARAAEISVEVAPGPSAVTAAVALSGLVDGAFSFLGFLPRKGTKRAEALRALAESPHPTVLFESPHRVTATLRELLDVCGPEVRVCVCREMTKKHEETLVLPLDQLVEIAEGRQWLGELTLVVERGKPVQRAQVDVDERARQLLERGESVKEATRLLMQELASAGQKRSKRDVYQRVLALSEDG